MDKKTPKSLYCALFLNYSVPEMVAGLRNTGHWSPLRACSSVRRLLGNLAIFASLLVHPATAQNGMGFEILPARTQDIQRIQKIRSLMSARPGSGQPKSLSRNAVPLNVVLTSCTNDGGDIYVNDEEMVAGIRLATNFEHGNVSCTVNLAVPAGVFQAVVASYPSPNEDPADPGHAEPPYSVSLAIDSSRDGPIYGFSGVQNPGPSPEGFFLGLLEFPDPRQPTVLSATISMSGGKRFAVAYWEVYFEYYPALQVTAVSTDFRPFTAQDPAAPCFGVKNQSNGCYAVLTATKIPAHLPDCQGGDKIFFDLQGTTSLKGYSSNACWKQDCSDPKDKGKDFRFLLADQPSSGVDAPTREGQRISTTGTPDSVSVAVTSFDYGGKTTVIPLITDDPDKMFDPEAPWCHIEADFVDQQGKRLKKSSITLPLDEDNNGIADVWEKPYANQLGLGDHFVDPSLDSDPGFDGDATSPEIRGDGFSAHDEYRGFHVLENGNRKWISTDPTKQDLFYTDPDGFVGEALKPIFGALTGSFITLHEVAPGDASPKKEILRMGSTR
jgi:hypothetical protein